MCGFLPPTHQSVSRCTSNILNSKWVSCTSSKLPIWSLSLYEKTPIPFSANTFGACEKDYERLSICLEAVPYIVFWLDEFRRKEVGNIHVWGKLYR